MSTAVDGVLVKAIWVNVIAGFVEVNVACSCCVVNDRVC